MKIFYIFLILSYVACIHGFLPDAVRILDQFKTILPSKVIEDIPSKLSSEIESLDSADNGLTTEYKKFPPNYKTTLYKDYPEQQTTVINVYPVVETSTYSIGYYKPSYQMLETSTTLVLQNLTSTVEFQTFPLLNSSTDYYQTIDYILPSFQHEILVYPTQINITAMTSTTLVNFTKFEDVVNYLPMV